MIFFGLLVQPVDKVIENAFARDLGGIIQQCMGYRPVSYTHLTLPTKA